MTRKVTVSAAITNFLKFSLKFSIFVARMKYIYILFIGINVSAESHFLQLGIERTDFF